MTSARPGPFSFCMGRRASVLFVVLLVAMALASCSDGESEDAQSAGSGGAVSAPPGDEAEGWSGPVVTAPGQAGHVHGLATDPVDGALLMATHNGLWRVAEGSDDARPVGETRHDMMGFAVSGPAGFFASGHPPPGSGMPSVLGLLHSSDRGRTWQPRSLMGEVDFHLLSAEGNRVYGVDSVSGQFFRSRDSGRRWQRSAPPGSAYGLAVSPSDEASVVLATDRGVFGSSDSGSTWSQLNADITGFIAWPTPRALYLVDASGDVMRSSDGGRSFGRAGSLGEVPESFGHGDGLLLAAFHGGEVKVSPDGGSTWQVAVRPADPGSD